MLKLYVIRHGKAVKHTKSGKDFDRELNVKGIAQINQIGETMRRTGPKIDQIIASGAKRTAETAEIIEFYVKSVNIEFYDQLYLAECETIMSLLKKQARGKTIVLVGHNYGLSDFVNYLCNQNALLSTGMLAEINFNFDTWEEIGSNSGQLTTLLKPEVHTF